MFESGQINTPGVKISSLRTDQFNGRRDEIQKEEEEDQR
jgi:hypothetical protein